MTSSRFTTRRRLRPLSFLLLAILGAAILGYLDHRVPWIWHYATWRLRPAPAVSGTRHIIFVMVDHFDVATPEMAARWAEEYRRFARRHRDSSGNPPRHTWFWSYHAADEARSTAILEQLVPLARDGLGEIELRLSHPEESSRDLVERLRRALQIANRRGAMIAPAPVTRPAFGFVHGKWALDDSRPGYCGVRDELQILGRMGAYADFTNPSGNVMHPRRVNSIYWAVDDPERPKSYATGTPLRVGGDDTGDLLIFEGPSVVRWEGWRLVYDRGDISHRHLPRPARVDDWVWANIHVAGRPEWIFVRPYMHGGRAGNRAVAVGKWRHRLHHYLESRYDDGEKYRLHYATAREAYNIARAAADGASGNPERYRDHVVPAGQPMR